MQKNRRYPKLYIQSKNELAKHISHAGFSQQEALKLINDVVTNYDKYWKDSKSSQPSKNKFVRNAKGKPLGYLLSKVNKRVLATHDKMLPNFIFGSVSGMNHKKAGEHLLGTKRKRVLLKMDIKGFFEGISENRVSHLFQNKFMCSKKASKLISSICCVPLGSKEQPSLTKSIGRGFATSPRLAVWCNLDTFIKLDRLVTKRLKGKDPRISIYVDDIGITASRVSEEEMWKLSSEVEKLLNSDKNQKLPVNPNKTDVMSHVNGMEILGVRLDRNKLSIGLKTKAKRDKLKFKMKQNLSLKERTDIRNKYKSLNYYKKYIES